MLKKRDIQRPGKRSTGTRDKQAEKRDVPAKTGRVATLGGICWRPGAVLPVVSKVRSPLPRSMGLEAFRFMDR